MYLADMHTHTQISPDSGARLVDMARAAAAAGLDELYVTDHCDLLDGEGRFAPDFDWPAALAQMAQAWEGLTGRLQLRLGLELGSAPFDPAAARAVLTGAGEALDFVLGSLHNWVGAEENIDFYYTDFSGGLAQCRRALENALDSTWALVTDCPDCYDSLAHIVYPLRYMARDGQALSLADYEERVRDIFTQVARTDHALEVNTNRGQDLAAGTGLVPGLRGPVCHHRLRCPPAPGCGGGHPGGDGTGAPGGLCGRDHLRPPQASDPPLLREERRKDHAYQKWCHPHHGRPGD